MPHTMPPISWLCAVFSLSRVPTSYTPITRHADRAEIGVHVHFHEHRAERVKRVLLSRLPG